MSRRASLLAAAVASVAASACSPVFDVTIGWTIDGDDPAAQCAFLPEGSVVLITADSRDNHDDRSPGGTATTSNDVDCAKGSATIQTGNFADVLVEVVSDDDVYGTAAPLSVSPGAASDGYAVDDSPVVADIALVQGTLHGTLTVLGRACDDAGASSFNVDIFENSEPRTNVLVKDDLTVECSDNKAEFTFAPVRVDARYVIVATADVGGATFSTAADGEGVDIGGANTYATIDLQAAD